MFDIPMIKALVSLIRTNPPNEVKTEDDLTDYIIETLYPLSPGHVVSIRSNLQGLLSLVDEDLAKKGMI